MYKKLFFIYIFFYSILGLANNGWVSSGADGEFAFKDTAWFKGDREIRLCINRNKTFPVDEQKAKEQLLEAISRWKIYYTTEKAHFIFKGEEINFNFKIMNKCLGDEDLVIYLNKSNKKISNDKLLFGNPFGFSRFEFDYHQLNMGKGYIWIEDPNKLYPGAINNGFYTILLHELGHVFGVGHINGTVMKSDISSLVTKLDDKAPFYTSIDYIRNLIFDPFKKFEITGIIDPGEEKVKNMNTVSNLIGNEYFLFCDITLVNNPLDKNLSNTNDPMNLSLKFKLYSNILQSPIEYDKIIEIPIKLNNLIEEKYLKEKVFKTTTYLNENKYAVSYINSNRLTYNGTIVGLDNKTYPVIVKLNQDEDVPYSVTIIDQNNSFLIFSQKVKSSLDASVLWNVDLDPGGIKLDLPFIF